MLLPNPLNRVGLAPVSGEEIVIAGGEVAGVDYSTMVLILDLKNNELRLASPLIELAWFTSNGTHKHGEALLFGTSRAYAFNSQTWRALI